MAKKNVSTPMLLGSRVTYGRSEIEVIHKVYNGSSVPHWHDFYELEVMISGSGDYDINGKLCTVGEGNAYLVTPEDYHRLEACDMEMYTVCFTGTSVDGAVTDRINGCSMNMIVKFDGRQFSYITKLLQMLEREFNSDSHDRERSMRNLLEYILICFLRAPELAAASERKLSHTVMRAVSYIKQNFKSELTLSDVAAAVSVSTNYFGTLFKNEMGVNFNRYLMLTRLRYASNLLRQQDLSVEQIAYASGFASPSYFSESYRKEFGKTPSEEGTRGKRRQ